MKAFGYDLSPALHIAEAKVIELLSGTSFAQFLMVFLTSEVLFFINLIAQRNGLEKKKDVTCSQNVFININDIVVP